MSWQLLPFLGILIGIGIGFLLPITLPLEYSKYMSVALLATLDSVFGGLRAGTKQKFDTTIFLTGFFSNAILAALLVFAGERLAIDLYMVALISFGLRIFKNIAALRRHFFKNQP